MVRHLLSGRVRRRCGPADGGAAVVEFVMISGLLVFLLFSVLQIALYCYARNVIAASAADGARFAANAGQDPGSGATRARSLITGGLNGAIADQVPCTSRTTTDAASGLPTVTVHCRGQLKVLLLPLHLPFTIDVSSSVLKEQAP